jgi:hypothetical protein
VAEAELSLRKKFVASLIAFSVLALLSWQTLSDDPMLIHDRTLGFDISIRFRTGTLIVLGMLAALTAVSFCRATLDERRDGSSSDERL